MRRHKARSGLVKPLYHATPTLASAGDHGLRGLRRLDHQDVPIGIVATDEAGQGQRLGEPDQGGPLPAITAGTSDCAAADGLALRIATSAPRLLVW